MQQKANGEMYNGQFKDSLYDGTGTRYYPDGKMVLAVFRKGTPVGKGVIYYPDGNSEIKQFTPAPEAISASDTFNVKYRYFKNSKGQCFWGQAGYNYSLNAWVPNGCGVFKGYDNWDAVFTTCYIDNNNPDYYKIGGTISKDAEGNIGFSPNLCSVHL
ncbi:MAG: hypothetical protein V9F01_02510 [Chitinophagaceae bacterium]